MDKTIITALIAAGTSIITVLLIKPFVDRQLLKFQVKLAYRTEQSKKIKDVTAVYKGRLLKSAELLNDRLKNFAKNHSKNWLMINDDYLNEHHYLDTYVYRFLAFFANIKIIEKNLIFLDRTIAQKADLRLNKYFRIFHGVMCDVDLYDGFNYDNNYASDHFFTTPFDNYTNSMIEENQVISLEKFYSDKSTLLSSITPVYEFFDGLSPLETRMRCERIKVFHLLLIAFLNEYGYDYQKTKLDKLQYLKKQLGEYKLLVNFKKMIEKYKLKKCFYPLGWILFKVE